MGGVVDVCRHPSSLDAPAAEETQSVETRTGCTSRVHGLLSTVHCSGGGSSDNTRARPRRCPSVRAPQRTVPAGRTRRRPLRGQRHRAIVPGCRTCNSGGGQASDARESGRVVRACVRASGAGAGGRSLGDTSVGKRCVCVETGAVDARGGRRGWMGRGLPGRGHV